MSAAIESAWDQQSLGVYIQSDSENFFAGKEASQKKTRPQYRFLGPETNRAVFKHGWEVVLFVSDLKTQNCGRVIFFYGAFSANFFLQI